VPNLTQSEVLASATGPRFEAANPVPLLMCSAHSTGELSLLRDEWQPDLTMGVPGGGYSAERRAEIVGACCAALARTGNWERRGPGFNL
jgi:hypothetical protein